MHRLCFMGDWSDPQEGNPAGKFTEWLASGGKDLNVEIELVDVGDPKLRWSDYGIPSAPPSLPVAVFVGRGHGGEGFVIDHWDPEPNEEDLKLLENSPVRQQLQQQLGKKLAVLLYSAAFDTDGQDLEQLLHRVVEKWSRRNELGISLIQLDRTDPRERTLLSFAGIGQAGPAWVGVVFGRGKLMAPPLVGEEITEGRINELINQLIQDCACSKPLPSMGVDLPLAWNDQLSDAVVALPSLVENSQETQAVLPSLATTVSTLKDSPSADLTNTKQPGNPTLLTIALGTLAVSIFVVVGISVVMIWRRR